MPPRRTPLRRSALARTTRVLQRRKRLNPVSASKRREIRESRPIVAAVLERDGGCVLRNHTALAGPCRGDLAAHHLRKQSKERGGWTLDNLVACCWFHNCVWIESNDSLAWGLGLVVKHGETTALAWSAMRTAGLAVGGVS